jgi:hypothetical protein
VTRPLGAVVVVVRGRLVLPSRVAGNPWERAAAVRALFGGAE